MLASLRGGNIPPAEPEENFYAQRDVLDMVA